MLSFTVLTDCYVNSNGADYKGRVATTTSDDNCVSWASELSSEYGYTQDRFPLLGDHKNCRNPGGYKSAPWCFIVDEGELIEGVEAPVETIPDGDYTG